MTLVQKAKIKRGFFMTLTQMRYFATTCELQNISLAAQMLYISQPALSATLADLEKEVGFKLFTQTSHLNKCLCTLKIQ